MGLRRCRIDGVRGLYFLRILDSSGASGSEDRTKASVLVVGIIGGGGLVLLVLGVSGRVAELGSD